MKGMKNVMFEEGLQKLSLEIRRLGGSYNCLQPDKRTITEKLKKSREAIIYHI